MRTKKILALLLSLAMTAGLAAGCSSQTPSGAQPSTAAPSTAAPGSSTPAAEPAGPAEQVLTFGRDWEKTSMDPATWSTNEDLCFGPSVFETLLTYDDNLNFVGELAESWEASEDCKEFTFHLRKGVQFHGGYGEMKASDVVFTIERMKDPEVKSTSVGPALGVDNMEKVEAVDDYTVKITLKEPDLVFLYKMAAFYCSVISEKAVTEMGLDAFAQHPIGTGPFSFDKGTAAQRTEIVRFDDYWGEKAKLDRAIFIIISEGATMFNAFESGELDMFPIVDVNKMEEYRGQPDKYTFDDVPGRQLLYVGMNVSIKPFDDVRVRQALFHAIDRDTIIKDYFMEMEQPAFGVLPEKTRYSVWGSVKPEYSVEKAKALLTEAGYPDGVDTVMWCPNDQISIGPSTLVQAYLSAAGIRCELQAVDFGVYIDTVKAGKAPIWVLYNSTAIYPDRTLQSYTSDRIAAGSSWCMYNNPAYDEAVNNLIKSASETDREKYATEAQNILIGDYILYPLSTYTQHTVMQSNVKGFGLKGDLSTSFESTYIE